MIELAPRNKQGLAIASPLIAGSGAVGFGDAWPPGVPPDLFGAVVTTPISHHPRQGQPQPRLAELPGGFLLATGDQNPGYQRVLRAHAANWKKLSIPLLVALAGSTPEDWPELAARLEDEVSVAGIELHVAEDATSREVAAIVAAVRRATTLPLLARLPVTRAEALAEACGQTGADALVVGTPPVGAFPAPDGPLIEAPVAGPMALPFTLRALCAVTALALEIPVVAAGGIHGLKDARGCLDAGAVAVQVRSLVWTDPAALMALARGLGCEARKEGP